MANGSSGDNRIPSHHVLFIACMLLFFITKASSCPPSIVNVETTKQEKFIASPGYPGNYPRRMKCEWRLISRKKDLCIKIMNIDWAVESSHLCDKDYLEIYDGYDDTYDKGKRYCGSNELSTFYSEKNVLFIRFHTDDSIEFRGFNISYRAIDRPVPTKPPQHKDESKTGAVIGGVVGGILCVLVLLGFACGCISTKQCRCRNQPQRTIHPSSQRLNDQSRHRILRRTSNRPPSPLSPSMLSPHLNRGTLPQTYDIPLNIISPPPYSTDPPPPIDNIVDGIPASSSPPPPYSIFDPHPQVQTSSSVPRYSPPHVPMHI